MNREQPSRTQLVPLEARHLSRLWVWERHPDARRQLLRPELTKESLAGRLSAQADQLHYIIEDRHTQVAVGSLQLAWRPGPPCPWGSFEIIVASPFRRRGYARGIIDSVPTIMQEWRDTDVIKIGVFADNRAARQLYAELGYVEISRNRMTVGKEQRVALMMSNQPARFRIRPIGFTRL